MKFMEALDILEKGGMVVRECWGPENGYLKLMYGMEYCWRVIINPTNAGAFSFSVPEMRADDWLELPLPEKKCEAPNENIEL